MKDLVIKGSSGIDVTTSLIVAEVFGKEHNKVMRDIENLSCSKDFRAANFGVSSYTTSQNKQLPMYEMTKDGFSFRVMGYTGAKAGEFKECFITEFNKREIMLKSDDYILMRSQQILQNRLQQAEQQLQMAQGTIDRQAEQLRISAPKVAYVDEVLQSQNTYNVNLIAKELGMSAETLNRKLKEMGVQYKQGGVWVLAHKYQNRGYTKTRTSSYTRSDGSVGTSMLTVFTEKGRAFIHSLFLGK